MVEMGIVVVNRGRRDQVVLVFFLFPYVPTDIFNPVQVFYFPKSEES